MADRLPGRGREDLLAILAALAIALATVIVSALVGGARDETAPSAATSPVAPAPPAATAPPATPVPSAAGGLAGDPGCLEWSDGCVVCQRTAQGNACSTPGIACTRGPLTCLRRSM